MKRVLWLVFGLLLGANGAQAFEKIALVDAWDFCFFFDIEKEEGVRQVFDHVAQTGADCQLWRLPAGGQMRFPSHVEYEGTPPVELPIDKRRIPANFNISGWVKLHGADPDHLGTASACCREKGVRFGLHWSTEECHGATWCLGPWNLAHPRYWCRQLNGAPWPGRASLAWPEVVEHKMKIADELKAYAPETVFLDFYRAYGGEPKWEYVEPVVAEWRKTYGCESPSDWKDPRWIALVKRFNQAFVSKLRDRMPKSRMLLGISRVGGDEDYDLVQRGIDWRELVRSGCLDGIVVMCVLPDWQDPWMSTRRIYESVVREVAGRCKVFFPVSAYSHVSRPGIGEYASRTGLPATEVVKRLLSLAAETGGDGIVMECVDYNWYSPESCRLIRDFQPETNWAGSRWIAVDGQPAEPTDACRKAKAAMPGTAVFRRRLSLGAGVVSARWTMTALGVFEAYANGRRVGEDFLKPGFDHVFKTRHSFSYEIAPLIASDGTVELSAEVSAGWWRDAIVKYRGHDSAFRGVLEVRWKDGRTERFGTDLSWEGAVTGPVLRAGIYDGERYDARVTPSGFAPVRVSDEFKGAILPMEGPTVRLREDLVMRPASAFVWRGVSGAADDRYGKVVRLREGWSELSPGETLVVDFGQNATALPRISAVAERGTELTIEPAETVNGSEGRKDRGNDGPEGSVYRENLRQLKADGAKAVYVFSGADVETYLPRFTFFGYRYLSLRSTGRVKFKSLESVPVSSVSSAAERGRIETGVPALNKFVSNVRWGLRSNYLSVPMDCPQRDERLGWTGDTQVFAPAAFYLADVYDFLRKWMRDMRDAQHADGSFASLAPPGPFGDDGGRFGYTDAGIVVPAVAWQMTGRREIVDENWEAMERYLDFVARDRFASEESLRYQWADWLSYEKLGSRDEDAFETVGGKRKVKPEAATLWRYLGGCYWLHDAQLMAAMAAGTGRMDAAKRCQKSADEALAYLRASFVGADGLLPEFLRDMQTPALFALRFGVLSDPAAVEKTRTELLANIRRHGTRLQTGFLGTSILMETLSDFADAPDVACSLLLQRENPSWLYSVDNGATTVWERWNSYMREKGFGPASMNSFNHYAYGSVVAWMFSTLAGIRPDPAAPGFRHFILAPKPDRRLGFVTASYDSPCGEIRSAWRYGQDGGWTWRFAVPDGTRATVVLPDGTRRESGPGEQVIELKGVK